MTTMIYALLLGTLQGATEFLPVSSSGHLVLVPWLLNWPTYSVAFYTLLHWGTAAAVVGYFWNEWVRMAKAVFNAIRERSLQDPYARLAGLIVLAGIPGAIAGLLLDDFFEAAFARPPFAAGFLLVTAAILVLAEALSRPRYDTEKMTWLDALLIGLAQAAAILPGISRSGSTIAAGMGRGLDKESAARFSFLLATPTILGAGILELPDLLRAEAIGQVPDMVVGFLASLVCGLLCIHFLLRYLQRRTLYPFAIYCALAGTVGLVVALLR